MKWRLRGAVCTSAQGGWSTHAWGKRAAMFTFQVDAEPVGILCVLQQEPSTAVGLLACSAGVGRRLLLTCRYREEKRKVLAERL